MTERTQTYKKANFATRQKPPEPAGVPMDEKTGAFMESRFGHDFSRVRIHSDDQAAESARALGARAFTLGSHIFFAKNEYSPRNNSGIRLLAHELTHTIQQAAQPLHHSAARVNDTGESEARNSARAIQTGAKIPPIKAGNQPVSIQREQGVFGTPPVTVRFPAVEEAARQVVELEGTVGGRRLTEPERRLVSGVFGRSIDYGRVTILPTRVLEYRTVGNVIRVPPNFTVVDAEMAETLVHEMTHVWQYQHGGTSYMGVAIQTQIAAGSNRNFAYDYQPDPARSFFEFTPEQQALIVENYHAMRRDRDAGAPTTQPGQPERTYRSNHVNRQGFFDQITWPQRAAQISSEFAVHEQYINQLRRSRPLSEFQVQTLPSNFMQTPQQNLFPAQPGTEMPAMRPLFQLNFRGL